MVFHEYPNFNQKMFVSFDLKRLYVSDLFSKSETKKKFQKKSRLRTLLSTASFMQPYQRYTDHLIRCRE